MTNRVASHQPQHSTKSSVPFRRTAFDIVVGIAIRTGNDKQKFKRAITEKLSD